MELSQSADDLNREREKMQMQNRACVEQWDANNYVITFVPIQMNLIFQETYENIN